VTSRSPAATRPSYDAQLASDTTRLVNAITALLKTHEAGQPLPAELGEAQIPQVRRALAGLIMAAVALLTPELREHVPPTAAALISARTLTQLGGEGPDALGALADTAMRLGEDAPLRAEDYQRLDRFVSMLAGATPPAASPGA
jgi:hypothetical protein